jgi:hypothetical protein
MLMVDGLSLDADGQSKSRISSLYIYGKSNVDIMLQKNTHRILPEPMRWISLLIRIVAFLANSLF